MLFHFFNPMYFVFLGPAILLMLYAQYKVKSAYAAGLQIPARLSGAAAARYILDQSGCQDVGIEEMPGTLSDHYDPRDRVLRLSGDVYHGRSATSVGIAAHESGHALQHATNYAPLIIRNAAVPAATFGGTAFSILLIAGMIIAAMGSALGIKIVLLGVILYCGVLIFQLINLPVEFDASARAKRILREYQIVDGQGAIAVDRVLNAAALTYVAATLQTLLVILYYLFRILGSGSRRG
ncbi:MAG TPA: zinc metallopeptidase [Planctomycetaceae bacterium]|jgi:Zn-dependent membrane protease YugP|nr:zinc metallopeptidase [Planctomycetaceae bacterium]